MVVIAIGIILVGGGILMLCGSFSTIRGNPFRSIVGIVVALVIVAGGVFIFMHRPQMTAMFNKVPTGERNPITK